MNALHKMQDYLQQTKVIFQRRSQKTYNQQATSRTNGNAAVLKHVNVKKKREAFWGARKCQETAEAETIFNGTTKKTLLQKNEALEKYVETVTMRAEALATTQVDFFKTLIERQQEAQKHLNELAAQLSQQNSREKHSLRKQRGINRRREIEEGRN